ncbi:MAG: AAA family ATPase [Pseudomonadota bacterium]
MRVEQQSRRYSLPTEDARLDALFESIPEPVHVDLTNIESACRTLNQTAATIFLMDDQRRRIIRRIFGAAEALAATATPDVVTFNRRLMSLKPWLDLNPYMLCVSGLAGVGKSALMDALAGFLDKQDSTIEIGSVVGSARAMRRFRASHGAKLSDVLNSLLAGPEGGSEGSGPRQKSATVSQVIKSLYREASFLLLADELQEISASSTASSEVTKLLLKLGSLGPVLVYCCNYSLLHKLSKRNQEEKDRVLGQRVILRPYASSTPEWHRYLKVLTACFDQTFQIDPERVSGKEQRTEAEILYGMTFGIPRKVVMLLDISLRLAKPGDGTIRVTMDDLQRAYRSSAFAVSRYEIERLFKQVNDGRAGDQDLHSPLDPVDGLTERDDAQRAKAEQVQRKLAETEARAQYAAMTAAERAALSERTPSETLPTKKANKPKPPKRKEGDLAKGQALFEKLC